ncbi:MAG: hypothetical protein ABSB32_17020 [Thermodesulfobacteriota bacterium]
MTRDLSIILFLARVLSFAEPEEMDIRCRLGSFDLKGNRKLKGRLILNKKVEEIKGINKNLQARGPRIEETRQKVPGLRSQASGSREKSGLS